MINKYSKYKVLAIVLFFVLCIYGICVRLYDYQVVQHESLKEASLRRTMRTYTQKASRGSILDRNGVPLVSNEMTFQVVFDYYTWDKERANEVILQLCSLMNTEGQSYTDNLPITMSAPFAYEGTAESEFTDLTNFLIDKEKLSENAESVQSQLKPGEVMAFLADYYDISDDYTDEEKRIIAGVRYEMSRQGFSSYSPYVFAADITKETASRISEAGVFLPGVEIQEGEKRSYETEYAAHILGRVGLIWREEYEALREKGYPLNAMIGRDGAEKAFEEYLRPIDGTVGIESNIDGDVSDPTTILAPQPGKDVYLTIDLELQKTTEESLERVIGEIKEKGAKRSGTNTGADAAGGAAVVIDIDTGEILASASYPTYSLETFSADFNDLNEDPLTPMVNRAIAGIYPPGSIFKMVTALAALEEGVVSPTDEIVDKGVYTYYAPSYTPACWVWNDYHKTHGSINVSEAIKYSCNYFFFEVSRIMGIDTLNKYAKALGLGELTGIEIAGEKPGNLAGPESREENGGPEWQPGETIQAAIGQSEQQFTPIQLANYMATLVNGGVNYKTHLLKKVVTYDGSEVVLEKQPEVMNSINPSQETIDAIKLGMLGATTDDGTASSTFQNYPIEVGGKTGSAETKKGASAHGTFLSFAPYDDPEIAVCVVIEHAGSGGAVAPVVKDIYDCYFGFTE